MVNSFLFLIYFYIIIFVSPITTFKKKYSKLDLINLKEIVDVDCP